MYRILLFFFLSLLYLEGIYHVNVFGFTGFSPLMMFTAALLLAAIESIVVRCTRKRAVNLGIWWACMGANYLLYAVQLVYYNIFARPLLLEIAITTGGDALTDFWGVALDGIVRSLLPLFLMAVPFVVAAVLLRMDVLKLKRYRNRRFIEAGCIALATVSLTAFVLIFNYVNKTEMYREYQELYAPEELAKRYGVLSLLQRDLLGSSLPELELEVTIPPLVDVPGLLPDDTSEGENTGGTSTEEGTQKPVIDTSPNVFQIDFDGLMNAGDKAADKLTTMLQQMTPSKKNEYTGMFEGYNLIYITAEAFSQYAVSEELTPTLYKMLHSGIVVEDYYVPLWQTSTSDGEYMNLMGQIPNGQHSFRESQNNTYPYSLPAYFAADGVKSYAYHNNSLAYYDRYLTHPNLGYQFKAAQYGKLSNKEKYKDWIFEMEGAGRWPASDYEMFVATIPEYINEERFHTYYMTVSGHANYSFIGNSMSSKNKEQVSHLECSSTMKAYIACNLELEKAMTYLLEELEKAGKLDKTLIVLSADHYPYGLSDTSGKDAQGILEEFTGKKLDALEIQRNCLIMYNSAMETVQVEKTCSSLDILPTILNLFGYSYDSRLFAGRDILSDSPSLVVFSNKSFITDYVIYDASTKKVTYRTDVTLPEGYVDSMKSYVSLLFKYSQGMLTSDYHNLVSQFVISDQTQ